MNKHLRAQAKDTVRADQPPAHFAPIPGSRQFSLRPWVIGLGTLFAAYVFLGPFVLKDEYQWKVIYAVATGKGESAFIQQTTPAKAAEAAAVASAAKHAEVEPAIKIAEGAERAKVTPARAIAAGQADENIRQARETARIDVGRQADINSLEVAKAAQLRAAQAYQDCVARAQSSADSSSGSILSSGAPGSLAQADLARAMALSTGLTSCERLKPQELDALTSANQTVKGARKID